MLLHNGGEACNVQSDILGPNCFCQDVFGSKLQALERSGGNQSEAARLLGIGRFALRYRMEKMGLLKRGAKRSEPDED